MDWISTAFLSDTSRTSIRVDSSSSINTQTNEISVRGVASVYDYPTDKKNYFDKTAGTDAISIENLPNRTKENIAHHNNEANHENEFRTNSSGSDGGHWEHVYNFSYPYLYSSKVCRSSFLDERDCIQAENCTSGLMNWVYFDKDNKQYPRFDVEGFRRNMRNTRILFIGSSLIRQQVQALVWTLGHKKVKWNRTNPAEEKSFPSCTTNRFCMIDGQSNITLCYQFMGSMATKIYREGNYTLDHHLRGFGDSSCLLHDEMVTEFNNFDLLFAQNIAWYAGLGRYFDSPTSPSTWVSTIIPELYHDAMGSFLSKVSQRTKTILVLGQVGSNCVDKIEPEPFIRENIPTMYGWNLAPTLWDTSISLLQDGSGNVQIVDVRDPLMQSVHAHPYLDCLHFCLNSAAVNIYLDKYWVEVFSIYVRQK